MPSLTKNMDETGKPCQYVEIKILSNIIASKKLLLKSLVFINRVRKIC